MASTFKFEIKHHFTSDVLFTAELEARFEKEPSSVQLGAAVKLAVKAKADLRGADLGGAYLGGADLRDADLRDAYLRGAYLGGADLRGADLRDAYLGGADLRDADLRGADLGGAKWTDEITLTKAPLQLLGLRWQVYILESHMQIGCEIHSHADWVGFDDRRILKMEGREALEFWRQHKDALLALCKVHAVKKETEK